MKEAIVTLFADYAFFIVFLHVLSAFVWVGGMIAIRGAVHPSLQHIEDPKVRIARTLEITQRLFMIVMPFIAVLIVTGGIMAVAMGFKGTSLYGMVHVKEAIWTIMTINYTLMFMKRNKAERLFVSGDMAGAKAVMAPIPDLMLPLNIALGIIALAVGVMLRGF
ncbi:hypothetical protein [Hydrogenimonas cancrithermarum]|uniref:Copper resistance protein D domain-containing protein n=1 Tax=Hydrogenimonas cancrithermarum TaxID=2993563 RepID=A0ABM8FLY3_9BACT|nr:hypothetical protein [Hydrogenimonas cancrithermarum]BDY13329.1 hypothetical protein HCR_16410 [Hydrogenimonas cancrithermarum]